MEYATSGGIGTTGSGARAARGPALLGIAMATVLAGCATGGAPSESAAPLAAVVLGPVIRLLDVPPTTDSVRVVTGRDGNMHVVVASNGPRIVSEIVVSPSGEVQQRRTVLRDVTVSSLDAAFDRHGQLHALIDRAHLVCERGVWRVSNRTPWEGLDSRPPEARFVPNAPDLVWSFAIAGSEIGAPGRWEVYGIGGAFGAGIIWPWFTRGSRAVLVAESPSGFGPWVVIDPEAPMDTRVIDAAADAAGNVFVAYTTAREGMLPAAGRYYVKLEADVLAGRDGGEWRRPGVERSSGALRAAKGTPLAADAVVRGESAYRPNFVPYPPHVFNGGLRMSTALTQRPRALVIAPARDAWRGRSFPLEYVEFDDFRWSSPIEVGVADHGGGALFGGFIWRAYDLVTTDAGRTFIVWPTGEGIVGRWIDTGR